MGLRGFEEGQAGLSGSCWRPKRDGALRHVSPTRYNQVMEHSLMARVLARLTSVVSLCGLLALGAGPASAQDGPRQGVRSSCRFWPPQVRTPGSWGRLTATRWASTSIARPPINSARAFTSASTFPHRAERKSWRSPTASWRWLMLRAGRLAAAQPHHRPPATRLRLAVRSPAAQPGPGSRPAGQGGAGCRVERRPR